MSIGVYGHSVPVTNALKEHVNSQFHKIEKFNQFYSDVNVVLEVQNDNHTAKCTIKVPHQKDIHAESTTSDMYKSIDALSLKVEQQLRKIKGIATNINHNKVPSTAVVGSIKDVDDLDDDCYSDEE